MNLQEKDMKIILELRKNSRESITKMARRTGIPVSTIFDKITQNKGGYIAKNTCLLNFSKIGFNTRAHVIVKVEREKREELRKQLSTSQNVNSVYKVNNGFDFSFEAVFRDVGELESFMELLRDKFGVIQDTVLYVLEDIKREGFMADKNTVLMA